ncbi:hypothetical protein ABPG75_003628 [Micractinium tetrahymenae]
MPRRRAAEAVPPPSGERQGAQSSSSDADLLLAFKATFDNGASLLSTWKAGTDPCAGPPTKESYGAGRQSSTGSWLGIWCDDSGRVNVIDLSGLGLAGAIPPGSWALPATVTELHFGYDKMRGQLPPESGVPPKLAALDIDGAGLTGPLPAWPHHTGTNITLYLDEPTALCAAGGKVPTAPRYLRFDSSASYDDQPLLTALPACP